MKEPKPPSLLFYASVVLCALVDLVRCACGGPCCSCGETEWAEARARRNGWHFGTQHDGQPGWTCNECLRAEEQQWSHHSNNS